MLPRGTRTDRRRRAVEDHHRPFGPRSRTTRFGAGGDGKAGAAQPVAGPDCATFSGADGLTTDGDGNLIIALNRQNKIVRLTNGGTVDVVADGSAVDFPASLDWNGTTLVTTNFAFANASAGKPASPGLLGIRASR